MMEAEKTSYRLKQTTFKGRQVPIVLQSTNGPCPLLAIANVLLLRNQIQLPLQAPDVSQERLITLVAEYVLDSNADKADKPGSSQGAAEHEANLRQNVADAISLLPKLCTGIDVNVRFHGIREFEFTNEIAVFDLLDISLVHGWLVDPQEARLGEVIGARSYNALVVHLTNLMGALTPAALLPLSASAARAASATLPLTPKPSAASTAANSFTVPRDMPGSFSRAGTSRLGSVAELARPGGDAHAAEQQGVHEDDSAELEAALALSMGELRMGNINEAAGPTAAAAADVEQPALMSTAPPAVAVPADVGVIRPDVATIAPDVATVSPDVATASSNLAAIPPDVVTVLPAVATVSPDVATVSADVATISPDVGIIPADVGPISGPLLVAGTATDAGDRAVPSTSAAPGDEAEVAAVVRDLVSKAEQPQTSSGNSTSAIAEPSSSSSSSAPTAEEKGKQRSTGEGGGQPLSPFRAKQVQFSGVGDGPLGQQQLSKLQEMEEAQLIQDFLETSQLTFHGLAELHAGLRPNQLAVFFRNNHFSTLFRHEEGPLYLLVTDQGYLNERDVVWERLDAIDGDTQYVKADFTPFGSKTLQEHVAAAANLAQAAFAAVVPPRLRPAAAAGAPHSTDADYAMALQLQDQEEAAQRAQQEEARARAAAVKQQPPQAGAQAQSQAAASRAQGRPQGPQQQQPGAAAAAGGRVAERVKKAKKSECSIM